MQIRVVAPTAEAARRLAETVWRRRVIEVTPLGPATQADARGMWRTMPTYARGPGRKRIVGWSGTWADPAPTATPRAGLATTLDAP